MSGYPLVLDGASIRAVVVGGGNVAVRKTRALLDAGARVKVVAPELSPEMWALAARTAQCVLLEREYDSSDLDAATFVVAATNQRDVNARVAKDARERGALVNVADDPGAGNCTTVAAHRSGDLLIGVTAGGVPSVAARVRDALGARFDERYAEAVRALGALRQRLLAAGKRQEWHAALDTLVTEQFCAKVEQGDFAVEVAAWR
jgi:siroheme synthase-like protein